MLNFFFLRHGVSEWNETKRWQGQQNPKLSAEGGKQVLDLALKLKNLELKNIAFTEIWSSDLLRASQTAQIIAEQLGLEVNIDERIKERFLSSWEGLTREKIENKWPGAIEKRNFPKDSESTKELLARTMDFLEDRITAQNLIKETDSKLLVVSHGGLITCLEESLGMKWERLSNLKGRWISVEPPSNKLHLGKRMNYQTD